MSALLRHCKTSSEQCDDLVPDEPSANGVLAALNALLESPVSLRALKPGEAVNGGQEAAANLGKHFPSSHT